MKKITLLVMFLMVLNMNAQWVTDTAVNTQVVTSESDDIKAIGMSDGKTYVVFWKSVPSPENYELRMQVIDVDGNMLLGTDGSLISDSLNMNTFTSTYTLNVDANNNLYVGVTATGSVTGYAFKLDSNGNHLWGASGVSFSDGYLVGAKPLSNGNTLVSWFDGSNGTSYMQMFNASGTAVWESIKQIAGAPSAPANTYELSDGGFVAVYHVLGNGVNSTLYAQRFNSNGDSQWTSPTQLSNKLTAYNSLYSGTQDGDIVYYGYKGKSSNNRIDSYVQRINTDGTLPWGINGMDFDTNETDFEQETQIAFSPNSQYVWAICHYTNANQSTHGEYVQKFDKTTGARQFTDTAKEVFPLGSSKTHRANLTLVNDQPVFLIEVGDDNGVSDTELVACMLDANGDFVWSEETKPLATYTANTGHVNLIKPVNGQLVTVFVENKDTGLNTIYAQNLVDTELLGVSEVELKEVSISFVNPIQNELKINSDSNIEAVKVYDLLGKLIYKSNDLNTTEVSINTSAWNSGLYLMTLNTVNGQSKGIKIIKK